MFVIFQVNAGFLINQLTKYLYIRQLNPLYLIKNCALHCRIFQKRSFFTTFLVFLTVDEVCYISNKNQPPNNLVKSQYFSQKTLYPSFKRKVCKTQILTAFSFFFNWDSLHARLNSHYEAWSYKKRSTKKITGYRKSVQKEPTVKRCLLILDLKPLRSQVKGKHSIGREFQSLAARGKKLLTQTSL